MPLNQTCAFCAALRCVTAEAQSVSSQRLLNQTSALLLAKDEQASLTRAPLCSRDDADQQHTQDAPSTSHSHAQSGSTLEPDMSAVRAPEPSGWAEDKRQAPSPQDATCCPGDKLNGPAAPQEASGKAAAADVSPLVCERLHG